MHIISSNRHMGYMLVLALLLAASGCAPAPTAALATATPQAPVQTESDQKTFEAEAATGAGPVNFPDVEAGLAELSSYQATLTISFDGTRAGQPHAWSKAYVMLAAQQPGGRQVTIEKSGTLPDLDPVFMAEAEGVDYERRGEGSCLATPILEGNSSTAQILPAKFLTGVLGAQQAGAETIDGQEADHYTFDGQALGQPDSAQSTGEMWVASEAGYILKYLLTTKGNADYFGAEMEGTLSMEYALTGINQPVTITLPEDCPPGMVDAPLMPDGSKSLDMPGILTYETSAGIADIAAFYQAEMPKLGWGLVNEALITETNAMLNFTQGKRTLAILVTTDGSTIVSILLGNLTE